MQVLKLLAAPSGIGMRPGGTASSAISLSKGCIVELQCVISADYWEQPGLLMVSPPGTQYAYHLSNLYSRALLVVAATTAAATTAATTVAGTPAQLLGAAMLRGAPSGRPSWSLADETKQSRGNSQTQLPKSQDHNSPSQPQSQHRETPPVTPGVTAGVGRGQAPRQRDGYSWESAMLLTTTVS